MPLALIQEAGTLSLEYDGPPLSLFATAVVQLELDRAIRQVSIDLLSDADLMYRVRRARHPFPFDYYPDVPFAIEWERSRAFEELLPIRPRVTGVRAGSIITDIGVFITTALADPDIRAAAIGVLSNVVTSLGAASARWSRAKLRSGTQELSRQDAKATSDLGPHLRGIAAAVVPYVQHGQRATIRFRHKVGDVETTLEIEIDDSAA